MVAVLAAASYYRIGFSPCLAICAMGVRVPGGSAFQLEPVTIPILSTKRRISSSEGVKT